MDKKDTKIIGLTGGSGTGKSAVAKHLAHGGAGHVDADQVAHELLDDDRDVQRKIRARFGDAVLVNNRVDRAHLGRIVFGDRDALAALNKIIHPAIIEECVNRLRAFARRGVGLVIIDAALLLDVEMPFDIDLMIALRCGRKEQMRRLLADGIPPGEVNARLDSQAELEKSFDRADVVVDTDRKLADVLADVQKIVDFLLKRDAS